MKFVNKVDVSDLDKIFTEQKIKESTKGVYLQKFKHMIYYAINEEKGFDRPPINELNSEVNKTKVMNYINSKKVTLSDKKSLVLKCVKCLEALKVETKSLTKDVNRICRIVDDRIAYNEANEKEKIMSKQLMMSSKEEIIIK